MNLRSVGKAVHLVEKTGTKALLAARQAVLSGDTSTQARDRFEKAKASYLRHTTHLGLEAPLLDDEQTGTANAAFSRSDGYPEGRVGGTPGADSFQQLSEALRASVVDSDGSQQVRTQMSGDARFVTVGPAAKLQRTPTQETDHPFSLVIEGPTYWVGGQKCHLSLQKKVSDQQIRTGAKISMDFAASLSTIALSDDRPSLRERFRVVRDGNISPTDEAVWGLPLPPSDFTPMATTSPDNVLIGDYGWVRRDRDDVLDIFP